MVISFEQAKKTVPTPILDFLAVPPEELKNLVRLFQLAQVTPVLSDQGGVTFLQLIDIASGKPVAFDVGMYDGVLLPKIEGLRRLDHIKSVEELLTSPTHPDNDFQKISEIAEIPVFSQVLLNEIINALQLKILRKALNLSEADFSLLLKGLIQLNLKLKVDLSRKDYLQITFENRNGVIVPLIHQSVGETAGWLIPISKKMTSLPRVKDLQAEQRANRWYQKNFGPYKARLQLFESKQLESFIACVREETAQNHPDQLPENQKNSGEKQAIIAELIATLQPEFKRRGLRLVGAKQVVRQSASDQAVRREMKLTTPFPLVDVLIVANDKPDINLEYVDILGWGKNGHADEDLTVYGNVCGFVLVSDTTTLHDRKVLTRNSASDLRRLYATQPKPTILTLDPALMLAWKKRGSPFPTGVEVEKTLKIKSTKKQVDYGYYKGFNLNRLPAPTVDVHFYEPETSHIGGTQITVVVNRDERVSNAVLLDRGWIFDLIPSWGNLGKGPQYVDGIMSFLGTGMYDMTRRLYRLDLLTKSFQTLNIDRVVSQATSSNQGGNFSSVEEFIILELYHRLGSEQFANLFQELQPRTFQLLKLRKQWKTLITYLEARHKTLFAQKTIFDLAAITHAHQDHTLGFSLIRDEIVRGFSSTTRALLLADHKISSNWLAQDVAVRKMRELPKVGSAYPVYELPYYPFEDGTRVEISPGIFVSSFEVYHSIPGCLGFLVQVEHKGKQIASVAYGGDYRDGRFFNRIGEIGGTDLLIVEGTNPPSARKASVHFTEASVKENFNLAFLAANSREDLVVIDLVKNAFERLEHIVDLARARGRSIVLSSRILKRFHMIHMVTQGRQHLPPIHPDDPNIFVWKPQKSVYKPEENEMFEMYGAAKAVDLSEHPERYVLIRENEKPEKLEDLGHRVTWIDSTYGPYTEAARQEKQDRQKFADRQGWTYLPKGFHATGHGPLMDANDPRAVEGVLAQLPSAKAKTIVPVHTQKRGEVSKIIATYAPESKVVERLSHPRSKIRVA